MNGLIIVLAQLHVVRVKKSGQEHVKEKESEEVLINRKLAELGDFLSTHGFRSQDL